MCACGGVSSTAEEAQGHSEIRRRGRKIGKIDRSDDEEKKEVKSQRG